MMITTTAGGVFMLAANLLALKFLIAPGSYGAFTTLLGALNLMLTPSAALQLVFSWDHAAASNIIMVVPKPPEPDHAESSPEL